MPDHPDTSLPLLHLNDLRSPKPNRPGWSLTFGAACGDAATCLDSHHHPQTVALLIDGIQTTAIALKWDAIALHSFPLPEGRAKFPK